MRLRGESHFLKEVEQRGTILELLSAEHPKAVNSFTGASERFRSGLGSQRRRMMNVCTLRCRAYFETGMNSRAAWAALDHLMKQAMFSCETQLDRWSVLDFFCSNFLSVSELPFGPREGRFSVCSERSTSLAPCHLCGRANGILILKNVFDNANFAVVWSYRAGESSIICAPNCSPSRNF